ncbi:MAG: chemotaxis protein CheC [Bacteroidota bacterium]
MDISDKQKDALTELVNISFSKAANSLSELTGQRVSLEVPKVSIHPINELAAALGVFTNEDVASVHQLFKGDISGDAMLLVNTKNSMLLSDILTDRLVGSTQEIDNSTREVLVEVGNIILNSFLGMFGNLMQVQFTFSVPELHVNTLTKMISSLNSSGSEIKYALLIYMGFFLKESNIEGYLVVVLGVDSMNFFIQKVEDISNL